MELQIALNSIAIQTQLKVQMKLLFNRYYSILSIYLGGGILLLILSFITGKPSDSFWNFLSIFGLVLLYLSSLQFVQIQKTKKILVTATNTRLDHLKDSQPVLRITDAGVHYSDIEINSETKWAAYTYFLIYQNHLLLYTYSPLSPTNIIPLEKLNTGDRTVLLNHVASILKQVGQ